MDVSQAKRTGRPTSALLLTLLLLWIVVGSIVPAEPVESWGEARAELHNAAALAIKAPVAFTLLERLATFVPVGLLFAWRFGRRESKGYAAACLPVALFALLTELAQLAFRSRHARLTDFLLAVAAGLIGAWLGGRLHRYDAALHRFGVRWRKLAAISAIVLGNIAACGAILAAHLGANISGWDRGYPLLIGNELAGDRPWRGRIRGVAIYPRDLTADDIRRLSNAPMNAANVQLREHLGVAALYLFDARDGDRVAQLAAGGVGPELTLPRLNPQTCLLEDGALDIRGSVKIASEKPAADLCDAIGAAQAFAVEVEMATADTRQKGPARIVSNSASPYLRNFMLGEVVGDLVLRVRTPLNGPNGTRVPFTSLNQPLTERWTHVVASYAHGVEALYINGEPARRPLNLATLSVLMFRCGAPVGAALASGMLFVTMAAAFTLLNRRLRVVTCVAGLCAAGLLPLLLSITAAAYYHHNLDAVFVASAIAGPIVGLCVGLAHRRD